MDVIYEIASFPKNSRPWRVDLFGEIKRNDNVPSDPLVEVLMSPLVEKSLRDIKVSSSRAVDCTRQKPFWVNAGYLPFIRIGSVWRDGVPDYSIGLDNYAAETFTVTVDETTCRSVKANLLLNPADKKSYLVPRLAHPLGPRGLRTKFLSIDHGGIAHRILIPMIECGRFWYFNSSNLTQRLLWGEMGDEGNKVYNPERSSPPNGSGEAIIWLRTGIPEEDASIVARCAFSERARRNARYIHESLTKAIVEREPLVPDIFPPFVGKTTLSVYGKRIKSMDNQWRFLVFWIRTCSHPFPWRTLRWDSDHDTRVGEIENPDAKPSFKNFPQRSPPKEQGVHERRVCVSGTEPTKWVAPLVALLNEERFPDLRHKRGGRLPQIMTNHKGCELLPPPDTVPIFEVSSGAGDYRETNVTPISIRNTNEVEALSRAPAYPAGLDSMRQVLQHLVSLGDIDVRYIEDGEAARGCCLFPVPKKGSARNWVYIVGRQRRQVLVAEIRYGGNNHFYLFEAERRIKQMRNNQKTEDRLTTLFVYANDFGPIDRSQIDIILRDGAEKRGVWETASLPAVNGEKLRHSWSSPPQFATRLTERMRRAVTGKAVGETTRMGAANRGAEPSADG